MRKCTRDGEKVMSGPKEVSPVENRYGSPLGSNRVQIPATQPSALTDHCLPITDYFFLAVAWRSGIGQSHRIALSRTQAR